MTRKKKILIWGGVVIVVAGVVGGNILSKGDPTTTVQVDLAKVGNISERVTASGRVQPQTQVDITAQVSAEIVSLHVNEGDQVLKGELLVQLDTVQLNSDVQQMRYSLDEIVARGEASKVKMNQNREEYERQKKLFEKKLTSETAYTNASYNYENSKAQYNASTSQVKTQRARLAKAKDSQDKTKIVSPMDGVVTFLNAEVGEIAQAQTSFTQGKTLMTISDLSIFEVDVEVDETEIAKVVLGQDAEIEVDAFPDSVFVGEVVEIGNSAIIQGANSQEYSINFRVKVRFAETSAHIRPGMSASVDITTATDEGVALVPYAAIIKREIKDDTLDAEAEQDSSHGALVGDVNAAELDESETSDNSDDGEGKFEDFGKKEKKTGVFVIRDGKAIFVEIQTGIADEKNIVALTGILKGDTVISGSFKTLRELEDGDEVEISERSLDKLSGKVKGGRRDRGRKRR